MRKRKREQIGEQIIMNYVNLSSFLKKAAQHKKENVRTECYVAMCSVF